SVQSGFHCPFESASPLRGYSAEQTLGIYDHRSSPGIGLNPQLERLVRLFQIAGHVSVIHEVDVKSLSIADAIAQQPRFRNVLGGYRRVADAMVEPQMRISHGKVGIDLDRAA